MGLPNEVSKKGVSKPMPMKAGFIAGLLIISAVLGWLFVAHLLIYFVIGAVVLLSGYVVDGLFSGANPRRQQISIFVFLAMALGAIGGAVWNHFS